ncbi:MAG: hypothetical protein GY894_06080 [Planctomycetes bacterium]|nr:hypothetical protein [Planctomycetota bacterium]MCP4838916.1 hypothetical protein [Planctomycetota bacterium]
MIFVSETTLIVASLCSVEPVLNHYWTTITEPSYQLDDVAAEGNSLLESFGCEMIGIGSVESIEIVDGDVFVGIPTAWPKGSCVQSQLSWGMVARIFSSNTPSVIQWLYEAIPNNDVNLFGTSIGASGGFLAAGAPLYKVDEKPVGRVDLFTLDSESNTWSFANQILSGDDRDHFGLQIAGTANWLAIGNTSLSYEAPNFAAISILQAPSFTSGVTIGAPDESSSFFGLSLAIHEASGPTKETFLIAGAPANVGVGTEFNGAYVYRAINGQWSTEPSLLTPEEWKIGQIGDADHRTDCFQYGSSVAITEAGDSLWAFVGDPLFDSPGCHTNATEDGKDAGCVYVYQYSDGTWTQFQRIHAPDCVENAHFGWSLAADGNIVVVGSPLGGIQDPDAPVDPHSSTDGAVYILRYSEGRWLLAERLDRVCSPSDHYRVGHAVDVDVMDTGDIHIVSGGGPSSSPAMTEWIIDGTLDAADDCNTNGIQDSAELGAGIARDANADGVLDQCQLDELDGNGNGVPDDYEQSESTRLAVVFLIEGAEATSQEAFDLQIAGLMESVGHVDTTPWPLGGRVLVTMVDEHGPIEPFRGLTGDSIFIPLEVAPGDGTRTTLAAAIEQLTKADAIESFRYLNKRLSKAQTAIDDLASDLAEDGNEETSIDQYGRLFVLLGDTNVPSLGSDGNCPVGEINGVWTATEDSAYIRYSIPRTRICSGLLSGGNCDGVLETDAAKVLRLVTNHLDSPTLQLTDEIGAVECISSAADIQSLCDTCGDGLIDELACGWDLNDDGSVNVNDLLIVVAGFGTIYDVDELLDLLAQFGCTH